MAKRKLISEPTFFPDLTIIGINCQLKDYRLAFFLNRDIHLTLVKIKDLPVFFEKEEVLIEFPLYSCYDAERRINYYLTGNNNAGNKMVTAYKQADFLLMSKGPIDKERSMSVISGIRKINGVQMVFLLENEKIKNLDGIMSDLELHMVNK
ncbi:MAG: IPExxxVDY family protein [Bacteroidota bacterium]